MTRRPAIDTSGISDLLRDLRTIDKRLGASLVKELRDVGNETRDKVRNSTAPPYRTGKMRRSVRTGVRRGAITLYSNLPQGDVLEWGGSIKPRGVPIEFPRTEFVRKEVAASSEGTEARLSGLLEATAARYSFE